MIKRILVSINKSPADSPETGLALALAKSHGARITGFTAVDPVEIEKGVPSSIGVFSYQVNLREQNLQSAKDEASKAIAEFGDTVKNSGLEFRTTCASGESDTTLANAWRFQDLCLISTQSWNPGDGEDSDISSVLHLVAMGLRPLIAVPPQASPRIPQKAMIALSGSLDSSKAMKHFAQMNLFEGISAHLVVAGDPKSGETPDELLNRSASYLEAHGISSTTASLADSGDRTTLLLDEISRSESNLLIIGSSYKRILTIERFGKHAMGLLRESPVPVFVSH